MFIIVPKKRTQAPPARPADDDPTAAAVGAHHDDDRGPVRTATACDSCRVRKTKCNGQRPCGPCQRKHIICVFSRPKDRNLPVSPAQATLLQHQQRRLRVAVQQMAAIIARHEDGVDADPSSFDVLEQLARYAPTDIDEEDDSVDEAGDRRAPSDSSARPLKARKRQRNDDTPPSTNASEPDQAQSMAPMFDLVPNPQQVAGSRAPAPGPVPGFDTILQFMQSMRDGRGALTPALHQTLAPANPTTSNVGSEMALGDGSYPQPMTMASDSPTTGAYLPPDPMSFDFTSLIDWETSLANFQNDQLFDDEGWKQNFLPDANLQGEIGGPAYSTTTNSFSDL